MKQFNCEVCGGKVLEKHGDSFVCQSCGTIYPLEEAQKMLSETTEKDAASKKRRRTIFVACVCAVLGIAAFFVISKVVIPASKYNTAISLMNEGNYEEAIATFDSLGDYKDSTELLDNCRTEKAYEDAVNLMNDGKYDEAITSFDALGDFKDSADNIAACETGIKDRAYDNAIAQLSTGDVVEAYEALIAMDGYKDSASVAESVFDVYKTEKLKVADVGDHVYFGMYEQDNDLSNGKEDIEWRVLSKENNRILVISEYALECKPYNEYDDYNVAYWDMNVTWEYSSLRRWLNKTFLDEAFTEDEQSKILETDNPDEKNPEYDTAPGNATTDKIYLLSISEAEKYFDSDEDRICKSTAYAITHNDYATNSEKDEGNVLSNWWLRSVGYEQNYAANVNTKGAIYYFGSWRSSFAGNYIYVRPAMWLDLSSEQ